MTDRTLARLSCVALFTCCCAGGQTHVVERNGNVFLVSNSGQERVLTQSGRDYDARLSPTGTMVVFCRKSESGDSRENELWQVPTALPSVEEVLSRKPLQFERWEVSGCGTPDFSPDGKRVYFMAEFSDTSHVIARADLETREVSAIADAVEFHVVQRGKYAGDIVAMKRKHTLVGTWYWYWLLDADGKELGAIGDENSMRLFRDLYERQPQQADADTNR